MFMFMCWINLCIFFLTVVAKGLYALAKSNNISSLLVVEFPLYEIEMSFLPLSDKGYS